MFLPSLPATQLLSDCDQLEAVEPLRSALQATPLVSMEGDIMSCSCGNHLCFCHKASRTSYAVAVGPPCCLA